jgi:hypothetical protein
MLKNGDQVLFKDELKKMDSDIKDIHYIGTHGDKSQSFHVYYEDIAVFRRYTNFYIEETIKLERRKRFLNGIY